MTLRVYVVMDCTQRLYCTQCHDMLFSACYGPGWEGRVRSMPIAAVRCEFMTEAIRPTRRRFSAGAPLALCVPHACTLACQGDS